MEVFAPCRGPSSSLALGLSLLSPCTIPGGLQAVAELLQVDYEMHKMTSDPLNLALRRYAGMALTNLTFGDVVNKVPISGGAGHWRGSPRGGGWTGWQGWARRAPGRVARVI